MNFERKSLLQINYTFYTKNSPIKCVFPSRRIGKIFRFFFEFVLNRERPNHEWRNKLINM